MFGTGYTGHFPKDSSNEQKNVSVTADGKFIKYYPHNLFRITANARI
jgi:hypothetical protein